MLRLSLILDLRNSGFGDQDSTDPDAITYVDKDSIAGFGEYDYDYYYDEEEEEEETEPEPEEDTESEPESEPESHTHEPESSTAEMETKGIKGQKINLYDLGLNILMEKLPFEETVAIISFLLSKL